MKKNFTIIVRETGAPVPARIWDFECWIDGEEESGSWVGRTPWDALREMVDQLEDETKRET